MESDGSSADNLAKRLLMRRVNGIDLLLHRWLAINPLVHQPKGGRRVYH